MFELNCETDWLVYADYLAETGDLNSEGEIREDLSEIVEYWYWVNDFRENSVGTALGNPGISFTGLPGVGTRLNFSGTRIGGFNKPFSVQGEFD